MAKTASVEFLIFLGYGKNNKQVNFKNNNFCF